MRGRLLALTAVCGGASCVRARLDVDCRHSSGKSNQLWDAIVIIEAAHSEMPWIPWLNGVQSWWIALSAPHSRTPQTITILSGRIFGLLVGGHVWLESGVGIFCSRWDLENGALR
ncbi:hypothetical protein V8E53_010677 [Lactarius tabidus]